MVIQIARREIDLVLYGLFERVKMRDGQLWLQKED